MSTAIIEDMKRTDHKVSKPAGDGNGTYSGKGKKVEKAGMAGSGCGFQSPAPLR